MHEQCVKPDSKTWKSLLVRREFPTGRTGMFVLKMVGIMFSDLLQMTSKFVNGGLTVLWTSVVLTWAQVRLMGTEGSVKLSLRCTFRVKLMAPKLMNVRILINWINY
jgi:hypothetical protein